VDDEVDWPLDGHLLVAVATSSMHAAASATVNDSQNSEKNSPDI